MRFIRNNEWSRNVSKFFARPQLCDFMPLVCRATTIKRIILNKNCIILNVFVCGENSRIRLNFWYFISIFTIPQINLLLFEIPINLLSNKFN